MQKDTKWKKVHVLRVEQQSPKRPQRVAYIYILCRSEVCSTHSRVIWGLIDIFLEMSPLNWRIVLTVNACLYACFEFRKWVLQEFFLVFDLHALNEWVALRSAGVQANLPPYIFIYLHVQNNSVPEWVSFILRLKLALLQIVACACLHIGICLCMCMRICNRQILLAHKWLQEYMPTDIWRNIGGYNTCKDTHILHITLVIERSLQTGHLCKTWQRT